MAARPVTQKEAETGEKVKVLMETRGEGGYFVAPPTQGYEFIQGNLSTINSITSAEYELLFTIARSFDQMPFKNEHLQTKVSTESQWNGKLSPFDDFNQRGDVLGILKEHGWTFIYQSGPREHYKRPGTTDSVTSANFHRDSRIFYVFSTSTEFEAGRGYNPVQVYAILKHNGDYSAASKALYAQGYGARHTSKPATDNEVKTEVFEIAVPEPLPNELLPVPQFDPLLLPEALRNFVSDTADRMQSPIEFVAAAVVVSLASVIGNRIRIKPKRLDDGWIVTPNLWAVVIGVPGKLKTPALQAGLELLKKREQLARESHSAELKSFEFSKLEREAQREAVKNKLKEAAKKGENTERFRSDFEVFAELEEPTSRTYVVNDATIEKLGVLLNRNPQGILLFRDELIGFLKTLDKEENAEAKAFFLECWNGFGSYTFDRITRGETRIENLTLSILGGIQPGVLASYLHNAIAGGQYDDGFIQRFQLAFYPDPNRWQLVDRQPDKSAASLAHECFARLDNLAAGIEDSLVVRFADDAQEFFYGWWRDLEVSLETDEFGHPALTAHFSKYRSLMPSLALVFHLLNVAAIGEKVNEETKVSLDAAMMAAAWCELLAEHAKRIYGIAIRQETTQAKLILQKIKQGKLKPQFTARDVWRNQWTGLTSSEECQKPLQILVDYGYLMPLQSPTTDRGGRPTVTYLCHLSLLGNAEVTK